MNQLVAQKRSTYYDLKEELDTYKQRLPHTIILIALINGGDLFCMCTETEAIYLRKRNKEYIEPTTYEMVWEPLNKTHENLEDLILSLVLVPDGAKSPLDINSNGVTLSDDLLVS